MGFIEDEMSFQPIEPGFGIALDPCGIRGAFEVEVLPLWKNGSDERRLAALARPKDADDGKLAQQMREAFGVMPANLHPCRIEL